MTATEDHRRPERLRQSERLRLAVEILSAYGQARRALRRAPIDDVVASLRSHAATPAASSHADTHASVETLYEARRLGQAVTRLLVLLPGDTRCLIRSLVLTQLLARRGISATLVIGTRPAPDFLAHAWVEHDGDPVLDPGDGSFGRLVEL
jgi:hypothetical protein